MSESAIQNLTESLDLIKCTIEAILKMKQSSRNSLRRRLPIQIIHRNMSRGIKNQTMVKMSLILTGETEGVSNVGDTFLK